MSPLLIPFALGCWENLNLKNSSFFVRVHPPTHKLVQGARKNRKKQAILPEQREQALFRRYSISHSPIRLKKMETKTRQQKPRVFERVLEALQKRGEDIDVGLLLI